MRELVVSFIQHLSGHFDGLTVGSGGDFGPTLSAGPFTIKTMFHQWDNVVNPSIHVQVIQETPAHTWLECCGGPTNLILNVRISVDQKGQGWSIAMALYEELRSWLCEINYSLAPQDATPTDDQRYVVIVGQDIVAQHIYEGDVFSIHSRVTLTYMRRFE